MQAVLYIFVAFLLGDGLRSLRFTSAPRHKYPAIFLHFPIALVSGLTIQTTCLYFYLWIWQTQSPTADWYSHRYFIFLFFFICLAFGLEFLHWKKWASIPTASLSNAKVPRNPEQEFADAGFYAQLRPVAPYLFLILLHLVFILWALFLSRETFFLEGDTLHAGVTVFSDLSPHSALVRSFGVGGNIPADYPHFSNAGMRYHFFFYFLAGILNRLGLPLDWAINLPSIIGTYSFLSLLTYTAYKITKGLWSIPFTFLLFCFRSSLSGFYLPWKLLQKQATLHEIREAIRYQTQYSGPLLHDDWGLYNLNVYANQRHLLWGLALLLIVLLYFSECLPEETSLRSFFQREYWLSRPTRAGEDEQTPVLGTTAAVPLLPFLLALPFSYWHGSAAIACLLILAVWALYARKKLQILGFAVLTTLGAFVMKSLFAPASAAEVNPGLSSFLHWGYTIENPNLLNVLKFLLILFGPALLFMVLAAFLPSSRKLRLVAGSICLPTLFALTVSLTPDVTVNHKFFMITWLLFIPLIADIFKELIQKRNTDEKPSTPAAVSAGKLRSRLRLGFIPLLALAYAAMLFTGVSDYFAYKNQSEMQVEVPARDPFSGWVYRTTQPDTVSLTPFWAMHSYFLTGRQSYYGHSYYAGSAGYPTQERYRKIKDFLEMTGSVEDVKNFPVAENLDYLMIDNSLRYSMEIQVKEEALARLFPEVAYFPEQDDLKIYILQP